MQDSEGIARREFLKTSMLAGSEYSSVRGCSRIEAFFVEERDEHVNPIGAKGIGEVSYVGVAAAVANAIFHATGKRIRHLPITLDKLL